MKIFPPLCRCRRCCGSRSRGRSTWASACFRARRCADPERPPPAGDLCPSCSAPREGAGRGGGGTKKQHFFSCWAAADNISLPTLVSVSLQRGRSCRGSACQNYLPWLSLTTTGPQCCCRMQSGLLPELNMTSRWHFKNISFFHKTH